MISNSEFMDTIFSDCNDKAHPIIIAFAGDPKQGDWSGQVWRKGRKVPSRYDNTEVNTYYSVSSFVRNEAGRVNRQIGQFSGMHVLCFDDVGTKVPWSYINDSGLKPTYVIETSPGNYHVGFKMRVERDVNKADNLLRAIIKDATNDGVDPGMGNVTRILRMPNGWNMKPEYVNGVAGFKHRLDVWAPENVYTTDELISGFGVDLDAVNVSVTSGKTTVSDIDNTSLTLDTVIETSEGFMTFGEYRESSHGKLRCQSTWCRPESVSWNGYLDRHADGEPHFVDQGTMTKYVLDTMTIATGRGAAIPRIETSLFDARAVEPTSVVCRDMAEILSVEDMVDRFVYVSMGAMVIDVLYCDSRLSFKEFQNKYRGSYTEIENEKTGTVKHVYHADLWLKDPRRVTADRIIFQPGGAHIVDDDGYGRAFNEYREKRIAAEPDGVGFSRYCDHVRWLIPNSDEYGFFMDWCAHMLQRPSERPQTYCVMITPCFGTGRSLVFQILSRIVGYAKSFDINKLLTSDFNDAFSKNILLTSDEVFMGFKERGDISSRLRDVSSAMTMTINAKFKAPVVERIYSRMLMGSNHLNPLDLSADDRRAVIISNPMAPRYDGAERVTYYAGLYDEVLKSEGALADIRAGLMARDITGFNPNKHALDTLGKQLLVSSNTSDDDHEIGHFIDEWPTDIVTKEDIIAAVLNNRGGLTDGAAVRKAVISALNRRNAIKTRGRVKIQKVGSSTTTKSELWILRDWDKWLNVAPNAQREQVYIGRFGKNYGDKTNGLS